jgi:hypothetical protein
MRLALSLATLAACVPPPQQLVHVRGPRAGEALPSWTFLCIPHGEVTEELVEPLYTFARANLVEAPDDTVIIQARSELGRITIKRRGISWSGTDYCVVVHEAGTTTTAVVHENGIWIR